MLPKVYRLPHSSRLPRGSSYKHPNFLLKIAANHQETPRFGVIISKKIDKRAVMRNRMRRLLHTFIQDNRELFPKEYDYLFIITSFFDELPMDLRTKLQEFLSVHHL